MFFTTLSRRGLAAALLLALAPITSAQEHLATWLGGAGGDRLSVVAVLGDVDADGIADHALGAPDADGDRGHVSVVSGATGAELWRVNGDVAGDRMGHALAGALDVDADGTPDVVLGAPGAAGTGLPGRVQVRSGLDGALLLELVGDQPGARLGSAVGALGDVDFDGRSDILAGASHHDGPAGVDAGVVYAIAGGDGHVLAEHHASLAGDLLGGALQGSIMAGDGGPDPVIGQFTMGDGGQDPVIGASQVENGGAGYLLELSISNFQELRRHVGGAPGDAFGSSVGLAGDVDGDGVLDVIGGSPAGYARVTSGATGEQLFVFAHGDGSDGHGSAVAGVGDVNGDGLDDLAVGAPLSDGDGWSGAGAGTVRVYSGASGSLLHLIHGAPGAGLGRQVAFAGDLDGDGMADLAASAPMDATAGGSTGSVFVFSLARWTNLHGGVPGENGVPLLAGAGETSANSTVELALSSARSVANVALVAGTSLVYDPVFGSFSPSQEIVVTGLSTDAEGLLVHELQLPLGLGSNTVLYYQFVVDDPSGEYGQARSNAVAGSTL